MIESVWGENSDERWLAERIGLVRQVGLVGTFALALVRVSAMYSDATLWRVVNVGQKPIGF
jgi:hypothetical protein